jgi:hypothetical protein
MEQFQELPLDFAKPMLSVRPGPGQQPSGWQDMPDIPKMAGGVFWEVRMGSIDLEDKASFVGSVE